MHPAHVPFQVETQPSLVRRSGDTLPSSRFFCYNECVRVLGVNRIVEILDEGYRIQILLTSILVGDPFTILSRVIEVQHRCHSVYAKPISMVFIEPEKRI